MPRLRFSTILVIVAVSIACLALVLFSSGVIQSQFKSSSSNNSLPGTAINSVSTAISANAVFTDYLRYPTLAAVNYTQQLVYLQGNVSVVENHGGVYESCFDPGEPSFYGCRYAQQMSGWIVWTWDSSSAASGVPYDSPFVAECYVVGMNSGNLFLDDCVIAQVWKLQLSWICLCAKNYSRCCLT